MSRIPANRAALKLSVVGAMSLTWAMTSVASAGGIFNFSGATLNGGSRWDAAPRNVTISGGSYERSLSGGLRFAMQGTSYQAYRDLFTWNSVPSVPDFTTAVNQAFNAWAATDPVSGLGSSLTFVNDAATPVVGSNTGAGGLDARGAEIDLFGSTDAGFWNVGNSSTQGETRFTSSGSTLTLTSGTTGYTSFGINGSDIILNSNPQAVYSLDLFRRLLTHEIGHSLGLADVEGSINTGLFIDDNYTAGSAASLTNNWASLVNPLNPGATAGLARYTVANADLALSGVDILMESFGVGIGPTNPVTNLVPLSNDDFNTRQFLYPQVPEPTMLAVMAGGLLGLRRRQSA
ncbi:MAG: hypothetical protein JWM57_2096 [Phycisphaerales bacterium]|nr:hypothetical protein [Phycisphaerales bacterium]